MTVSSTGGRRRLVVVVGGLVSTIGDWTGVWCWSVCCLLVSVSLSLCLSLCLCLLVLTVGPVCWCHQVGPADSLSGPCAACLSPILAPVDSGPFWPFLVQLTDQFLCRYVKLVTIPDISQISSNPYGIRVPCCFGGCWCLPDVSLLVSSLLSANTR